MPIVSNDDLLDAAGKRHGVRDAATGEGSRAGMRFRVAVERSRGERTDDRFGDVFGADDDRAPEDEPHEPGRGFAEDHQSSTTR